MSKCHTTINDIMKNQNTQEDLRIATYNCQGLRSKENQVLLADDFQNYKMAALCVQETHMVGYGIEKLTTSDGKPLHLYYSGNKEKHTNGVGILIDAYRKVDFKPVSDRICLITTKLENENRRLVIICAYAPTLEKSEKSPEKREDFYDELESILKTTSSRDVVIIALRF